MYHLHVRFGNRIVLLALGLFVGFLEQTPLQNAVRHPLVVKLTHY